MGLGRDILFEEGAELGTRRGRQHGDAGVAGEEPVLTLHGMSVFAFLVLRCRPLLDGGDDQALVRVGRAASGTCRIAPAADEGLVRLEEAAQRTGRILAQPVAQFVRHGPRRLVRHPQFALQKFGRDAALVAAHEVGGKKPLRQIRPRPMKHRSRGHRLLAMAGAALVDPRTCLQPPGRPPAAAGTHKTVRPTKLGQVLDASLLRPEPRRKLQKPSHPIPLPPTGLCYSKARRPTRTFSEPALTGQGYCLKEPSGKERLIGFPITASPRYMYYDGDYDNICNRSEGVLDRALIPTEYPLFRNKSVYGI